MSPLVPLLAACALLPGQDKKPEPLRYLRPAPEQRHVLESEVTTTTTDEGTTYVSRTDRPNEKMTLTIRSDAKGRITSAEAVLDGSTKRVASLTLDGKGNGRLNREGTSDFLKKLPPDPVVTTAPDWSDIFALVKRYDAAKGGKQEFAGLWIHPVQPMKPMKFAVERTGEVTVKVKDEDVKLARFQVTLRSGDYVVWADDKGRVVRLVPAKAKNNYVVLQGFQEATKGLNP